MTAEFTQRAPRFQSDELDFQKNSKKTRIANKRTLSKLGQLRIREVRRRRLYALGSRQKATGWIRLTKFRTSCCFIIVPSDRQACFEIQIHSTSPVSTDNDRIQIHNANRIERAGFCFRLLTTKTSKFWCGF